MRTIITIMALLTGATAFAQNTKDFDIEKPPEEKEIDTDARLNAKQDKNDKTCALLKIETTRELNEFTFDGAVFSEQKFGEIWVYFPPETRYTTIKHKTLGFLDCPFGSKLKEATVYVMKLKTPPKEEEKATLRVYVDDEKSGVEVYINGQPEGYAPLTIDGFAKERKTVEWVKKGYRREKKLKVLEAGYNEIGAKLYRTHINGFHIAAEGLAHPATQQWGGNLIIGYRFNAHLTLGVGGGYHSYVAENTKGARIPAFIDFRANLLRTKLSPYLAAAGGVCVEHYTNSDTYVDPTGTITMQSEHRNLYAYYQASAGLHLRCSDALAIFAGAGYNNMVNAVVAQAGLSVTFVK